MEPAKEVRTSVVANIVTAETIIVGTIELPTVAVPSAGQSAYNVRLLDLLNNPRLGSVQADRVRDSIVLTDVSVLPKAGPGLQVAGELFVRPEGIICAYEHDAARQAGDLAFNEKMPQRPERVVVITSNGLYIQGTFLGGTNTLAAPKQKRFVPLIDARLGHTDRPHTRLAVPYMALNYDAIVAFSKGAGAVR
jgi:hypothetical protein